MSRGRLSNDLLKNLGYGGYIGISYVEMEYAKNEAEYLLEVMKPIYD